MSVELKIIIIIFPLLFLLFIMGFGLIFFYLKRKVNPIDESVSIEEKTKVKNKLKEIEKLKNDLNTSIKNYNDLKEEYSNKINNLDKLNKEELEKEFFKNLRKIKKDEINQIVKEANQEATQKSASIIVSTMESMIEPLIQEHTTTSIKVNDDQIKGRIIGRDGRNKRAFEITSGVDLVVEKDSNFITVSSHNPIRREIAKNLLNELIKSKSIEPTKIENTYKEVKESFEKELFSIGKDVIENHLKINDLDSDLYPYIGRLKFRSSLGQNALNHVVECACIASNIAEQLNLDVNLAKKVALLHDIGKSIDYEFNNNHIDAGIQIAKKLNLGDEIINAIESHHGLVRCSNIYSEITKIADTISASRPGARINSYSEYFSRVQELENIINEFKEVSNAYVIKSGRTVRVMVNPYLVEDFELNDLANKIKDKIEHNNLVKGYNIKVILIKETRVEFETKANN